MKTSDSSSPSLFSSLSPSIIVFVDGASSGNPGPGGWGAILGLPNGTVQELGGYHNSTTNNRMELTAAIESLLWIRSTSFSSSPIQIYSDSTYVIKGITEWIWNWQKRGWVSSSGSPVANPDLWKQLFECTQKREIRWNFVKGHSGVPGNERADQIAVSYSQKRKILLYQGPRTDYPVSLLPSLKP